jgi:polyisoprenoid-binding protein YceI
MKNLHALLLSALIATPALAASQGADVAKIEKGTYAADQTHTAVSARVDHMGFSKTTLRFAKASGEFTFDPAQIEAAKLDVSVDSASLSTDNEERDKELRGAGFFNVASFPAAHYVSGSLVRVDATHARVNGKLTLLGVTRDVPMEITLIGVGTGFANDKRVGVIGHMQFKRSDFGMKTFLPVVGDEVTIDIDAEFSKKNG